MSCTRCGGLRQPGEGHQGRSGKRHATCATGAAVNRCELRELIVYTLRDQRVPTRLMGQPILRKEPHVNHPLNPARALAHRRTADVAAFNELGAVPERRPRTGAARRAHPDSTR